LLIHDPGCDAKESNFLIDAEWIRNAEIAEKPQLDARISSDSASRQFGAGRAKSKMIPASTCKTFAAAARCP